MDTHSLIVSAWNWLLDYSKFPGRYLLPQPAVFVGAGSFYPSEQDIDRACEYFRAVWYRIKDLDTKRAIASGIIVDPNRNPFDPSTIDDYNRWEHNFSTWLDSHVEGTPPGVYGFRPGLHYKFPSEKEFWLYVMYAPLEAIFQIEIENEVFLAVYPRRVTNTELTSYVAFYSHYQKLATCVDDLADRKSAWEFYGIPKGDPEKWDPYFYLGGTTALTLREAAENFLPQYKGKVVEHRPTVWNVMREYQRDRFHYWSKTVVPYVQAEAAKPLNERKLAVFPPGRPWGRLPYGLFGAEPLDVVAAFDTTYGITDPFRDLISDYLGITPPQVATPPPTYTIGHPSEPSESSATSPSPPQTVTPKGSRGDKPVPFLLLGGAALAYYFWRKS